MSNVDDITRIQERIRSLASAFTEAGHPYLLSKLGKDLGDDLRTLKIKSGSSLADFIENHLSDEFEVVLTGAHGTVQALVRSDRMVGISVDEIQRSDSSPNAVRYNYRFWAAFSVPLKEGRRFLNLQDFTFQDMEEEPRGNFVEIQSSFIAPEGIAERDVAIRNNVQKWISDNGFSVEQFSSKPRRTVATSTHHAGGRSILEAMIEALDRKQLSNTSLTLDVIADLHRRRV